jgi:cathepsin L
MKSFALATVLGAANALNTVEFEYMNYMATFNKQHTDVEMFQVRLENFQFVDAFIKEHNASNATYTAGHNQFSDWSEAEYKSILGYVRDSRNVKNITHFNVSSNADSVDWVTAGAVTPVKDQGQCGSCWAFSSTGSLEGAHFKASGELLSLSEQQLVDCAGLRWGNYACNGGLQTNAYKYYEAGNDPELESSYGYTGVKGSCQSG